MNIPREVKFADGTVELIDATEFYKIVESFAATYGLGGCKTLSEFARMIDEEDPATISGFISGAAIRNKVSTDHSEYSHRGPAIPRTPEARKNKSDEPLEVVKVGNRKTLVHFLKQWGADKKQIEEAVAKIDSGQIKVSKNDYSYINSDTLMDPNFDFDGTLKKMSEDVKNSVQINVGWDSFSKKQRESNGGRK